MEEIAILGRGGHAQYVLDWRGVGASSRQRVDLLKLDLNLDDSVSMVTYYFDRGIGEVDEGRCHLTVVTGCVQCSGIPERQDRADELSKAFHPLSICAWAPV